jgi:two-component system LytT family response regulator
MGRELTMMDRHASKSEEARIHIATGMRVVLFDRNANTLANARDAVAADRAFVLVGESRDWHECEALLDRFLPEILIANLEQIPAQFLRQLSPSAFPILIGLMGDESRSTGDAGVYDILHALADPDLVRGLLARAQFEIYRRKADELSSLLQCYLASAGNAGQYLSRLKVEEGNEEHEMAVEDLLYIAADGNYLRIHTHGRAYEMRETMTGISARLDPARFVRVHRSFIVNLSHVLEVTSREGSTAFARLSNGMEVPVGPNYREEFDSIINMRNRLSA